MALNTLKSIDLVVKNMTSEEWEAWDGVLRLGQLGVETDTGKLKVGNGQDIYKNLEYLNMTPDDLEAFEKSLGKLATKNEIGAEDLSDELRESIEAIEGMDEPVIEYGSAAEFPEEGKAAVTYIDSSTGKFYRWVNGRYVPVSGDYKLEVISNEEIDAIMTM